MIILNIYNPDSSLYWKEHFNNKEELNKWLEEEQTRPYWNSKFTYLIEDKRPTPEEIAQQEAQMIAEQNAQKALKDSAKSKLKALGLTDAEVMALIGG